MYTILKYRNNLPTVFRYESKSKKVLLDLIYETLYGKVKYKYANELKRSILKIVKVTPGILDPMPKIPLKIIRDYNSFRIIVSDTEYKSLINDDLDFAKKNGWNDDYDYCKKRIDKQIIKDMDYFSLITLKPKEKIKKQIVDIMTIEQQKLFRKSFDVLVNMSLYDLFLSFSILDGEEKFIIDKKKPDRDW